MNDKHKENNNITLAKPLGFQVPSTKDNPKLGVLIAILSITFKSG